VLQLSGLEPLKVTSDFGFVVVGERTNITGSPRFSKLILGGDFDAAVAVARQQVKNGANILDVNMDEGMIDSEATMTRFLNLIGSEPEIARIPVMIDSSKWSVIEAGLRCTQGKGVVNSISLKNWRSRVPADSAGGSAIGAATIVMAFDEQGPGRQSRAPHRDLLACLQAAGRVRWLPPKRHHFSTQRAHRRHRLEEHRNYAVDFIESVRWIKRILPGADERLHQQHLRFRSAATIPCARRCTRFPVSRDPAGLTSAL
jgi:5-methyltetrahydrofolate--homocysteine methyltransferase